MSTNLNENDEKHFLSFKSDNEPQELFSLNNNEEVISNKLICDIQTQSDPISVNYIYYN